MRFTFVTLVFSLLLWQKDSDDDLPLHYRPWPGGLYREQGGFRSLQATFCWEPDLCWVVESPWGSCLAGVAMALLWALLENWVAACLVSSQTQPARPASCMETETARETDLETSPIKSSLCLQGQPSASGSESYEPPSERHSHYFLTCEGTGKRRQEEVLYSEYKRSGSSSSSSQCSLLDVSSSSSSAPPSSSSPPFCLSRFKNLDFLCASGDPSSTKCSLETIFTSNCGARSPSSRPESESSDPCSAPHEEGSLPEEEGLCLQAKGEPVPRSALLLLEDYSETERVSLSLQPREVHTQTSFARINIVQSSAYAKKDHVFRVEKSLQVQMGPVHLRKAQPPLPKHILPDDAGKRRKPAALSLVALTPLQHTDQTRKGRRVASLCGLLGPFEKAIPMDSSQGRECPGLNTIFARASSLDGFRGVPSIMEKMDKDTRDFLEFHVKKKMLQWECGMPSVVTKSVAMFQSLLSLCQDKPASDSRTPTETVVLTSRVHMLSLRSFPHVTVGSRHASVVPTSSERILGPKETSILSSWEPGDIDKLAFHTAVKMLEIQMGAFPEMVGNSFQLFCGLSEKPLPKVINSGNKIPKSKHPSLPFLTQENICILDLNVKRKCLTYTRSFSTVYTKLVSTTTSKTSWLSESEEEPMELMAQLLVSIWRQIQMVEISGLGLDQRLPFPQLLDSSTPSASPLFKAKESPETQFQDGPLKKPVAHHQVPAVTPRPLEEQRLDREHGQSHPEKPPEQGPSQRALHPFFDQPDLKTTTSRKAMKLRAEASIIRTSIYLELELKKEKLNLHFKKKMRARLQPLQGAELELTIGPRRKGTASPAPQQAHSNTQPLGRPRRSFCYVCMPSDESGAELKTVCWSLPKWILEMNGYRTPKVARFASKPKTPQPVRK